MHLLKKSWTVLWRILLFLTLWALLSSPAIMVIKSTGDGGSAVSPTVRFSLEVIGALAALSAAWLMARLVDRRAFATLGFALRWAGLDLLLGVALGSAMILISLATLWLAGWANTVPVVTFSWRVLALTGAAMLLNAIFQEVLVRGYVLQTIESQFNVAAALVLSSVFFTLLHTGAIVEGGVLPALNLFAAGLLLGLAYTVTRNLWLPFALHFSWNFLQGPVLGIAVSGQAVDSGWRMLDLSGPPLFTGGDFGLEGGLVATVATTAGIASLWKSRRWLGRNRRRSRRRGRSPERESGRPCRRDA